ncbi:S-layer homology domain-containing protein [Paenibacillus gorillae]|uniref:S-layer homology domain-containing protein n=1 Tax=Paenibacillus gorillae TaxID=1243662 RepID=UPI0004ADF962|nr:S-layer homology domain-containing protein [Paenibacillus gorillae]
MVNHLRVAAFLIVISCLLSATAAYAAPLNQSVIEEEDEDEDDGVFMYVPETDITNHPAERLFQWAELEHIIDGYPDFSYKPDQLVIEAEFLKMLYRAFGIAIPTATRPRPGTDWTEGPYSMATYFNHAPQGVVNQKLRSEPITKLHAAEIISAANGVHYNGEDAVAYLIGYGMANSSAKTPSDFHGNDTFTRAEALQWIRQLALRGMLSIQVRPKVPSDPLLLPSLPASAIGTLPDFSEIPLGSEDFNLLGADPFPAVKWGASKQSIDDLFGYSKEKDMFSQYSYPDFSAHFNKKGQLDAWTVRYFEDEDGDVSRTNPRLRTNKGIIVEESTLIDVLEQYGTVGYIGKGIASYYYSKNVDGSFTPINNYSSTNRYSGFENKYVLSFSFDEDSLAVKFIFASTAYYAYNPMDKP